MVGSVFQIQWIHFRIHVRRCIRTQTQVFDKKGENSAEKNKYDTGFKNTSTVNRTSELQLFRELLKT